MRVEGELLGRVSLHLHLWMSDVGVVLVGTLLRWGTMLGVLRPRAGPLLGRGSMQQHHLGVPVGARVVGAR